ncbi:HAP2/GCS1 like protein [Aduncisulcus paluster]|uniref:HAP2/GCS1 like protein n=1 Tax=Aduncisulcus paluster TaxID=2918883 RepID=A0ABQ5K1C4_9EUKA|nr:HAP2/GCS1 like protein [Aduncisulcus paluster]
MFNSRVYEEVITSNYLTSPCVDSGSEPTCGYSYDSDMNAIDGSEGMCCNCQAYTYDTELRSGITCGLTTLKDFAHCLRMSELWYAGFLIGNEDIYYSITCSITTGSGTTAETQTFTLDPSLTQLTSADSNVFLKIVGDFEATALKKSPVNKYLLAPMFPSDDDLVALGKDAWLIISDQNISLDGSLCNRVGTSFTAFNTQTCSNSSAGDCLANQASDLYDSDLDRIDNSEQPLYLVDIYGDGCTVETEQDTEGSIAYTLTYDVPGEQTTMMLIELAADSISFVTNEASDASISDAYVEEYEALAEEGKMIVVVKNEDSLLNADFSLSVTECSEEIMTVPSQTVGIEAQQEVQRSFSISSTSPLSEEMECTVYLRSSSSSSKLYDTKVVTFTPKATDTSDGIIDQPGYESSEWYGRLPGYCVSSCGLFNVKCLWILRCYTTFLYEIGAIIVAIFIFRWICTGKSGIFCCFWACDASASEKSKKRRKKSKYSHSRSKYSSRNKKNKHSTNKKGRKNQKHLSSKYDIDRSFRKMHGKSSRTPSPRRARPKKYIPPPREEYEYEYEYAFVEYSSLEQEDIDSTIVSMPSLSRECDYEYSYESSFPEKDIEIQKKKKKPSARSQPQKKVPHLYENSDDESSVVIMGFDSFKESKSPKSPKKKKGKNKKKPLPSPPKKQQKVTQQPKGKETPNSMIYSTQIASCHFKHSSTSSISPPKSRSLPRILDASHISIRSSNSGGFEHSFATENESITPIKCSLPASPPKPGILSSFVSGAVSLITSTGDGSHGTLRPSEDSSDLGSSFAPSMSRSARDQYPYKSSQRGSSESIIQWPKRSLISSSSRKTRVFITIPGKKLARMIGIPRKGERLFPEFVSIQGYLWKKSEVQTPSSKTTLPASPEGEPKRTLWTSITELVKSRDSDDGLEDKDSDLDRSQTTKAQGEFVFVPFPSSAEIWTSIGKKKPQSFCLFKGSILKPFTRRELSTSAVLQCVSPQARGNIINRLVISG